VYSACIFCGAGLGRNAAVESFPVGLRLAFDAANGRLWVVCPRCARWNLTPLEERWEAVEECERLFRGARLRVSTDNVGLATLHEGVDLVRIGAPLRPEFAAWRYGGLLGQRHGRQAFVTGAVLAGIVAAGGGALLGVAGFIAGVGVLELGVWLAANGPPGTLATAVRGLDERPLLVRRRDLADLRVWGDGESVHLRMRCGGEPVAYDGADAVRAAAMLLPHVNRLGGDPPDVDSAVRAIEAAGEPGAYLATFGAGRRGWPIGRVPLIHRLALEMAVHEEREHRALEGELAELERAWRAAEEIARIADDLLVPAAIRAAIARAHGAVERRDGGTPGGAPRRGRWLSGGAGGPRCRRARGRR
jgi:hypothetical protein